MPSVRVMAREFSGKKALVSGAASGIGRATAVALSAKGADLILLDRDRPGLEMTKATLDGRADLAVVDLSDLQRTEAISKEAIDNAGGVDFLVNVAGITVPEDTVLSMSGEKWDHLLKVNLVAPGILTKIAAMDMIARNTEGKIVNIGSSSSFRALMVPAGYAAAKAGLVSMTRATAAELGRYRINVNAVIPGLTRSNLAFSKDARELEEMITSGPIGNLFGRLSEPHDVAAVVVFLCSRHSRQITGQAIHTSAGSVV